MTTFQGFVLRIIAVLRRIVVAVGPARPVRHPAGARNLNLGLTLIVTALAVAVGLLVFPVTGVSSLQGQCVVCEHGNCEDGAGGSSCTSERSDGQHSCETEGGCECTKIVRRFWFDAQVCAPAEDEQQASLLPGLDTRIIDHGGHNITLTRVGPAHFAGAAQCGSGNEWVLLARQLPSGQLAVTSNPLVIRFQRWVHGLAFRTSDHRLDLDLRTNQEAAT